jgi:hypothetical protein
MGDHFRIRQVGCDKFYRLAVEFAGDAKLVLFYRGGFGRGGGGEVKSGSDADIQGKREVFTLFPCLFEVQFKMTAGIDIDRQRVLVDDLKPLDGRVAYA